MSVPGRYFDGASATPHAVTLAVADGRLVVAGPGIHRDWNLADLRAADAPPPLMRLGPPHEAARVEFADEGLRALLDQRCPDLRRRPDGGRGGVARIVLWSIAAGLSVILAAIFGMPVLAGLIAPLVPEPAEARFGASVETQVVRLLGSPPRCADPAARAVLDRLVARMTEGRGLPPSLTVGVRRHGLANALTLPGGRVMVLSDLIAKAESADEFAAVLAHEFGHVAARDPVRSMIQASGTSFLLSLVLGDFTGSTLIVALGQAAIAAGYSRDAERAADAYAVETMARAGGNGAALASILERIAGNEREDATAFLRSHPVTRERAAAIRALAGPGAATRRILSDADWTTLKGICGPARRGNDRKPDEIDL